MNGAYSPVPELNALKEFQDGLEGGFFSPGFELFEYGRDVDWFCGGAPDAYLDRLVPFAYATSSGSYYALWRRDDRTDLAALPVVFFGDEGDLQIEACDLRELFRLLSVESDDPEERTRLAPARQEYLAWLDRTFGLAPFDSADDADGAALAEHTRRFAEWVAEFASEDLLDQVLGALGLERPAL
ncbi:hypothetical protein [Nocardiopsis potens]|uniref:hypothetical protein n=1 Tax=Nocardiopsis potens TaxID=1246458 RepID=UPI000345B32A|nr:hypothetical protein [Nocardiopsis potens]